MSASKGVSTFFLTNKKAFLLLKWGWYIFYFIIVINLNLICLGEQTWKQCYYECIEREYFKKFNCIPNPFLNTEFILIDSSQELYSICTEKLTDLEVPKELCQRECMKNCEQEIFYTLLDNHQFDMNETKLVIKRMNMQEITYSAEGKQNFIEFMSNIGGLFGLWFGLSFIDMSEVIRTIFGYSRIFLERLTSLNLLRTFKIKLLKFLTKFSIILGRIQGLNWNRILTFVTLPVLLYQILFLLLDYLHFSYDISFEFHEYKQINGKISVEEMPAITVCNEQIFERIFFDQEFDYYHDKIKEKEFSNKPYFSKNLKTKNQKIQNFLILYNYTKFSLKMTFLLKYFDVETDQEVIDNIHVINNKNISIKPTLDELDFFDSHFVCVTNNKACNALKNTTTILSPFGKCHTYLGGDYLFQNFSSNNIEIFEVYGLGFPNLYLTKLMLIHSSNTLPILEKIQFISKMFQG